MVQKSTHFELFLRRTPKADWKLVEALPDRSAALVKAHGLLKAYPTGGIRVVKEVHDQTVGDYNSVVVARIGRCDDPKKSSRGDRALVSGTPCHSPSDLFGVNARKTILELMPQYLARHRLLPAELVLRPDVVQRLEASGTELTQAIQRVAIARADGDDNLHQLVRQHLDLVERAINKLLADVKKKVLRPFDPETWKAQITEAAKRGERDYAFNFTLVDRLRTATNWDTKLSALLDIWEEAEDLPDEERGFLQRHVTDLFEEWLASPGAISSLCKNAPHTGGAIEQLIDIIEGKLPPGKEPAARLSEAMAQGVFDGARKTLLRRALTDIGHAKRLVPDCLTEEFNLLKRIGDRLVRLVSPQEQLELVQAFEERSLRLMSLDTLEAHLDPLAAIDRPGAILSLSDNLAGETAKGRLCAFLRGEISHARFERAVLSGSTPPIETLKRLADLQTNLLKARLPENDRIHGAEDISGLAGRLATMSGVFARVANNPAKPIEAAAGLLQLGKAMPRGSCAQLALNEALKLCRSSQMEQAFAHRPEARPAIKSLIDDLRPFATRVQ